MSVGKTCPSTALACVKWPTWEDWEDWCTEQAPEGVERIEPPTTHRSKRARRQGRAPADLGGIVDGLEVKAECKQHNTSSDGGGWRISKLKEHQGQALELCHLGGGVAGVLVCFDGTPWWLPWVALREAWALVGVARVGVKTLSSEWLQVHAVAIDAQAGWWAAVQQHQGTIA